MFAIRYVFFHQSLLKETHMDGKIQRITDIRPFVPLSAMIVLFQEDTLTERKIYAGKTKYSMQTDISVITRK